MIPIFESAIDRKDLASLLPELDWLDSKQDEMTQLLVQLCNINSGTFNLSGLENVREILSNEFSSLGGTVSTLDVHPLKTVDDNGEIVNRELGKLLHIDNRRDNCPTVLLCIHMDTVYPKESGFQACRNMDDGRINGPGVADAKGGLVVMLYALRALGQSAFAKNIGWEVIINPDEEIGSPGSESFLMQRASQADLGLLFEPSLPNGDLVSSRKGVGNFSFVVRGRSAHSGREFELGRNAIVCCCQLMNEIHALNELPGITFNIGRISGGDALNVVPDLAIGRVNVRVETSQQMQSVQEKFARLVDEYNRKDGFEVSLHGRFTSPPKEITQGIESLQKLIENCGLALGQQFNWRSTGGASDGNKFAAGGLPNIDTLGPLGGAIHSENEFMMPDSLVLKAKWCALAMMAVAKASL